MNVLILRKDGKISVTVTADPIGDHGKLERWTDQDVISYLKGKNVLFGDILKGGVLTNTNPGKVIHEWVFEEKNSILTVAESLSQEIDREILNDLLALAEKSVVDSTNMKKSTKKKKPVVEKDEK